MAAALPKRHLVAVTKKASEFRLLFFYTLWGGWRKEWRDGWREERTFKIYEEVLVLLEGESAELKQEVTWIM